MKTFQKLFKDFEIFMIVYCFSSTGSKANSNKCRTQVLYLFYNRRPFSFLLEADRPGGWKQNLETCVNYGTENTAFLQTFMINSTDRK